MQIVCRCKYCGYVHISNKDEDLSLEIDFLDEVIRFICRKCKKENKLQISFEKIRKERPLPGILPSAY